jgi:sugar lactone lactonase YvrE
VTINRYSSKLDEIINQETELQPLAGGYKFVEGPVWCSRTEQLYFTDFPNYRIYTWSDRDGARIHREQSGRAVGLTLDAKGRLLACESQSRQITRTEEDGTIVDLVSRYQGKRLNNTNDLVVKKDGTIYFTDPYSTSLGDTRELPFNGVYRYDPESDTLDVLADDFEWPNGIAFSPDETLLYVDDTRRQHIRVFDVAANGTLQNGRLFAEMDPEAGRGGADGLKIDHLGNAYVTGPGGIWIFASSGERLGRIEMPEVAANLCFGSPQHSSYGSTLFITASATLYSLKLNVFGACS